MCVCVCVCAGIKLLVYSHILSLREAAVMHSRFVLAVTFASMACSCSLLMATLMGFPSDWERETKLSVISDSPAGRSSICSVVMVARASSRSQATCPKMEKTLH